MWRLNPFVVVLDSVGNLKPKLSVELYRLVIIDLDVEIDLLNVGIILTKFQSILKQLRACATKNLSQNTCRGATRMGMREGHRSWTKQRNHERFLRIKYQANIPLVLY